MRWVATMDVRRVSSSQDSTRQGRMIKRTLETRNEKLKAEMSVHLDL